MTKLLHMDPEREQAATIVRGMLDSGSSLAEARVRINRECPGLDPAARRWTLLEIERERERLSGPVHSQEETIDSPRAGKDAEQYANV